MDRERDEYRFALRHWIEQIGDPGDDEESLASISRVHFADAIAALGKVGRKPKSLFLAGEDHSLANEQTRTEAFEAIGKFLETHLGPGAPRK